MLHDNSIVEGARGWIFADDGFFIEDLREFFAFPGVDEDGGMREAGAM